MQLTLISSNIRFDNPADGAHSWSHRRSLLVETLLQHSPDIIATQEGRYDQLKDLESLLPGYVLIDQHRSWIKERMYPCIYLKEEKFEILKSEDLWLSETPEVAGSFSFESAFPRLMTMVSVQPKNSESKILLVNTHLDHMRRETRVAQSSVLSEMILRRLPYHQALVLMGDFNDSPSSPVMVNLKNRILNLVDSWSLFNKVEETSHHNFLGEMKDGERIDWILIQGKAAVSKCVLDKTQKNGLWPSDHFPVVCQITI